MGRPELRHVSRLVSDKRQSDPHGQGRIASVLLKEGTILVDNTVPAFVRGKTAPSQRHKRGVRDDYYISVQKPAGFYQLRDSRFVSALFKVNQSGVGIASCKPNLVLQHTPNGLQIRVVRSIRPGDELVWKYNQQ